MPEDFDFDFEPDFDLALLADFDFEPDFDLALLADFDFEPDFDLALAADFDFEPDFDLVLAADFDFEPDLDLALVADFDFEPDLDLALDFVFEVRLVLEELFALERFPVRLELVELSCLLPPLSLTRAPVAKALPLDLEPLSRKTIHYRNGSCTL